MLEWGTKSRIRSALSDLGELQSGVGVVVRSFVIALQVGLTMGTCSLLTLVLKGTTSLHIMQHLS